MSSNHSIIALVETWLDTSISSHEISIPGYSCIRRDRHRHGGGILLYVRNDIRILSSSSPPTLELLFATLQLRQGSLLLDLYYRPPSDANSLSQLDSAFEDLSPAALKSAVLLGDFNVNLLSTNGPTHTSQFLLELASKFNFTHVINSLGTSVLMYTSLRAHGKQTISSGRTIFIASRA